MTNAPMAAVRWMAMTGVSCMALLPNGGYVWTGATVPTEPACAQRIATKCGLGGAKCS
jgi:hypothetical protein